MNLFKRLFKKQTIEERSVLPIVPPPPPAPEPLEINELSVAELIAWQQASENMVIVDLRQSWEYRSGHIPGAINIPVMQFPESMMEIPKNQKIILQCYHGFTSLDVAGYLIENGWPEAQVFSLIDGMSGWVANQGIEALEQEA